MTDPRIYVASLSDYNAGRLHGTWIDADQEPDEIHAEIKKMLRKSKYKPAEEWAIHDTDGFEGIKLDEFEDIERVSAVARALVEGKKPFALWYSHEDQSHVDPEDLLDSFQEAYVGKFPTAGEWVAEEYEDSGELNEVPDSLRGYIDWEKIARDRRLNGDVWFVEEFDGVHVFNVPHG